MQTSYATSRLSQVASLGCAVLKPVSSVCIRAFAFDFDVVGAVEYVKNALLASRIFVKATKSARHRRTRESVEGGARAGIFVLARKMQIG